jgi:hypothetical protein
MHVRSSDVIERNTARAVATPSSASRSAVARHEVFFVMMPTGLRKSASTAMQPRVMPSFRSIG